MPDCKSCGGEIGNVKETIQCKGDCRNYFHVQCTQIKTEENVRKPGSNRETWLCVTCKGQYRSTSEASLSGDIGESALSKIMTEMNEMWDKLDRLAPIERKLNDFEKSVKFCCDKIDDFTKEVLALSQGIDSLKNENSLLAAKNTALEQKIVFMDSKINLINSLADVINVNFDIEQISDCYRLPKIKIGQDKIKPSKIIIKFVNEKIEKNLDESV